MTAHGVLVLDVLLLLGLGWVLDLVRRGRLWVGYGVIFVVLLASLVVLVSVPGLLPFVQSLLVELDRFGSLTTAGLIGVGFLLIYVFSQLTILSNRLARVVQELAIREGDQQPRQTRDEP